MGEGAFQLVYQPLATVYDLEQIGYALAKQAITGEISDVRFTSAIGQAAAQGAGTTDILVGGVKGAVLTPVRLYENVAAGNYEAAGEEAFNLAVLAGGAAGIIRKAGAAGPLEGANFAQKTFAETFSKEGQQIYSKVAGTSVRTIDDLADALRSGRVSPNDIPVDYITRGENTLILNTRTSQALERAGIPRSEWRARNQTGVADHEIRLDKQLRDPRSNLTEAGTPTVRPR